MNSSALSLLLLLFVATVALATPPAPPSRPNIVLINADDLGAGDVGFMGSDFHETPNLDTLAASGMVFTKAYAGWSNCQPSRACLMSGNYTPRHGVYTVDNSDDAPVKRMRLIPIPNKDGLAEENITIADVLKRANYTTGHFGKWHLYKPAGAGGGGAPALAQGFDVSVNLDYASKSRPGPPEDPKAVFGLTTLACDFLQENSTRPFFLYLAHHATHTVLQARPETLAKFQAKRTTQTDLEVLYAACTYDLDASIGILMAKLRQLGLEENTLIFFTSDNGGRGKVHSQAPLRASKASQYEGGIRIPLLASWPGKIPPGTTFDKAVAQIDLFPTILEAANIQTPKELDGQSLLPVLQQRPFFQERALYWHYPAYKLLDKVITRPNSIIQEDNWKLILNHEEWILEGGWNRIDTNGATELYNLSTDPGETQDLSRSEPGKRDELLNKLLDWCKLINAPFPTEINPLYIPKEK